MKRHDDLMKSLKMSYQNNYESLEAKIYSTKNMKYQTDQISDLSLYFAGGKNFGETKEIASGRSNNLPTVLDGQNQPSVSLPTPMVQTLPIERALRDRATEILRAAHLSDHKTIRIARPVRVFMGRNFVGNLPWEPALDWDACKALKDYDFIERMDPNVGDQYVFDMNDQLCLEVKFKLTSKAQDYIEYVLSSDPQYVLNTIQNKIGDAGLQILQILSIVGGVVAVELPLDNMGKDSRLQRLINHKAVTVGQADINVDQRSYVIRLALRQAGVELLDQATKSGWNLALAPWTLNRADQTREKVLQLLTQPLDEVVNLAPQPIIPLVASTRKGRGGFGMTARRLDGRISDHTSFRWKGRPQISTIETWNGSNPASSAYSSSDNTVTRKEQYVVEKPATTIDDVIIAFPYRKIVNSN